MSPISEATQTSFTAQTMPILASYVLRRKLSKTKTSSTFSSHQAPRAYQKQHYLRIGSYHICDMLHLLTSTQ